jgi:hypothetical protein
MFTRLAMLAIVSYCVLMFCFAVRGRVLDRMPASKVVVMMRDAQKVTNNTQRTNVRAPLRPPATAVDTGCSQTKDTPATVVIAPSGANSDSALGMLPPSV